MEARVMKMESELRVLRAAMARVPQSILRELTARGALLVVRAPAAELEDFVAKAIQVEELKNAEGPMVVEEESGEEGREEAQAQDTEVVKDHSSGEADEEEVVTTEHMEVVEKDDEEETAWACATSEATATELMLDESEIKTAMEEEDEESSDDSSDDEDDESDESSDSEEEEKEVSTQVEETDQREEIVTSQESAASGSTAEPMEERLLSLSAFDKAIAEPTSASPTVSTAPSRPPLPFAMPSLATTPLRPLALARRPAAAERSELPQPPATSPRTSPPVAPTPTLPMPRPVFMPTLAKHRAVAFDLPANFEVQTKDSVPVAWEKWCCGDAYHGFPPFRLVTAKHVANKAVLRRLSDLRCAMLPIETLAKQNNLWSDSLTPPEAARVFQRLAPMLPLSQALPSGRKRTREIAWSTALNIMRRGKKSKLPQPNNGYISEALI